MDGKNEIYENFINNDIKNRIKSNKQKKEEQGDKLEPKPKRTKSGERISKSDIITMEHFDSDDEIVRKIKGAVNNSSLSLDIIYEHSKDNDYDGYNLFYGLCTRSSMSSKTFKKWLEILNMEITLVKK